MTSISSSSRLLIRRSRDTSSCVIRSRSLGLVISPLSIRSRSRTRRALTDSTSASTFSCSAVRSSTRVRASMSWCSTSVTVVRSWASSASSGRVASRCRSWSARASSSCRSSSFSWANGSAFRVGLLSGPGRAGSEPRVPGIGDDPAHAGLHRIPQRVREPRLDHRQPGPLGRPVRHVDQRGPALLQELRRPGGAAGRWSRRRRRRSPARSPSRKSPAPPATATRRTIRSGSPATRRPVGVRGQRRGDPGREVTQRGGLDLTDPPGAGRGQPGIGELDEGPGRLLVGMRGQHRPDHPTPPRARQHRLDPHLVDHLELADRADGRRGAGQRPEAPLAG